MRSLTRYRAFIPALILLWSLAAAPPIDSGVPAVPQTATEWRLPEFTLDTDADWEQRSICIATVVEIINSEQGLRDMVVLLQVLESVHEPSNLQLIRLPLWAISPYYEWYGRWAADKGPAPPKKGDKLLLHWWKGAILKLRRVTGEALTDSDRTIFLVCPIRMERVDPGSADGRELVEAARELAAIRASSNRRKLLRDGALDDNPIVAAYCLTEVAAGRAGR